MRDHQQCRKDVQGVRPRLLKMRRSSSRVVLLPLLLALVLLQSFAGGGDAAQPILSDASRVSVAGEACKLSLAIDDVGIAAVGEVCSPAAGAVRVYERSSSGEWSKVATLQRPGEPRADMFGWSVAVDGGYILVGAPRVDEGRAYLFARRQGDWGLVQELAPCEGALGDDFGWSVSMRAKEAAVGAWQHDVAVKGAAESDSLRNAGAVYTYDLLASKLVPAGILVQDQPEREARFGAAVAVGGGLIAAGAPYADAGSTDSGLVYVFERREPSAAWQQTAVLRPSIGREYGLFGKSVDSYGSCLVVSSPGPRHWGAGSAYLFRRGGAGWQSVSAFRVDGSEGFASDVAVDHMGMLVATAPSLGLHGRVALFGEGVDELVEIGEVPETQSVASRGGALAVSGNAVMVATSGHGALIFERLGDTWRLCGRVQ